MKALIILILAVVLLLAIFLVGVNADSQDAQLQKSEQLVVAKPSPQLPGLLFF